MIALCMVHLFPQRLLPLLLRNLNLFLKYKKKQKPLEKLVVEEAEDVVYVVEEEGVDVEGVEVEVMMTHIYVAEEEPEQFEVEEGSCLQEEDMYLEVNHTAEGEEAAQEVAEAAQVLEVEATEEVEVKAGALEEAEQKGGAEVPVVVATLQAQAQVREVEVIVTAKGQGHQSVAAEVEAVVRVGVTAKQIRAVLEGAVKKSEEVEAKVLVGVEAGREKTVAGVGVLMKFTPPIKMEKYKKEKHLPVITKKKTIRTPNYKLNLPTKALTIIKKLIQSQQNVNIQNHYLEKIQGSL